MKLRKKMFISYAILDIYNEYVSPLAQGRGLKRNRKSTQSIQRAVSPLAQGRGLKLMYLFLLYYLHSVAPRAGAWIETYVAGIYIIYKIVSPLAQGRGLKLLQTRIFVVKSSVAPRAGAWIETFHIHYIFDPFLVSPLAQGRGLKLPAVAPVLT